MITPGSDEIVKLAEKYTTIPVCREIYADMITPIALLRRLQTRSDRFFLLESVEGGEKWARYSFLGYDPILRATCKNGRVTLEGAENRTVETDKPLSVLREVLSRYRAPHIEGRLRLRAASSATSHMRCSAMPNRRSGSSAAHGTTSI